MSEITNLKDLRAALVRTVPCEFLLDNQPVRLEVRRLSGPVDELRRALLREPQPQWSKERNEYDLLAPAYRAQRDLAEDKARAVVVYHCCPEVAAEKPGLTDPTEIHRFVKDLLPPTVCELIALTALAGGLNAEVKARANFTSTPDLAS